MQRNAWKDVANLQINLLDSCTKSQLHVLTTVNSKKRNRICWKIVKICAQIVLKCLYLARIGRSDILCSVNKLARTITKCTRACDKRLARLISYVRHTSKFKQCCQVGNTDNNVGWDCFRTLTLRETSESTSGGILCFFGIHKFVRASWMCEKQTSVSNCSTEAEFIAFDAVLRMDGIPALTLWIW